MDKKVVYAIVAVVAVVVLGVAGYVCYDKGVFGGKGTANAEPASNDSIEALADTLAADSVAAEAVVEAAPAE